MRSKKSIKTKNRPSAPVHKKKRGQPLIPKGSAHNKRRARAKGLRVFSASHNKPSGDARRYSTSAHDLNTKRVRGLSLPVLIKDFDAAVIDKLNYDVSIMLIGSKLPKHSSVIGCIASTKDCIRPFVESSYSSIVIIGTPPEDSAIIDEFEKGGKDYQEIPNGYLVKPGEFDFPLTKFIKVLD